MNISKEIIPSITVNTVNMMIRKSRLMGESIIWEVVVLHPIIVKNILLNKKDSMKNSGRRLPELKSANGVANVSKMVLMTLVL